MGEKNKFSSPGAYAGNRRGRKAAGIIGGVCATGAGLIVLIAFLMRPTSFTTFINNDEKAEDAQSLRLKTGMGQGAQDIDNDESGQPMVVYESLKSAWPTTAKTMLEKYQELRTADKLTDAQIIKSENQQSTDQLGIIYNVYLENTGEKALPYQFSINLADYTKGDQKYPASSLYSYLRIVICVADVANPESEVHHWFAATSNTTNVENDHREAVSAYTASADKVRTASYCDKNVKNVKNEQGETVPQESPEDQWIWYTNPFVDSTESQQMALVPNLTIQPKATTRFSVIVYLEGNDPDCKGQPPQNENFALQAEIALM